MYYQTNAFNCGDRFRLHLKFYRVTKRKRPKTFEALKINKAFV